MLKKTNLQQSLTTPPPSTVYLPAVVGGFLLLIATAFGESWFRKTASISTPNAAPVIVENPVSVPAPPTSKPPDFPEGYVLYPDTNGVMRLWEVVGERTVTNTVHLTEVEAAHEKSLTFLPESDGVRYPFALTVTSFDFDAAYTRLIISETNGVYILQPQTSTNLNTWSDTDIFISVNGSTNSAFRLVVEL